MIVALHSAPEAFFKAKPPHSNDELLRFVQKAASMGFKAVQIGPLSDYVPVEGERLHKVLDALGLERNVHVGGLHDARKMALSFEECAIVKKQMHDGILLCKELSSILVSVHPPFFKTVDETSEEILSRTRTRFLELLKDEADFASRNGIKVALESFCYPPFIFEGLEDFARFVEEFPSEKLGVLLDAGHVHQIGIDLERAVRAFGNRLLDVHIHDATQSKDFRRATHLPLGKGNIDFLELLSALREAGYDGWLTLEVRGTEKNIIESKECLELLVRKID
jgi:sugar phosphate isomerase/epimerase